MAVQVKITPDDQMSLPADIRNRLDWASGTAFLARRREESGE